MPRRLTLLCAAALICAAASPALAQQPQEEVVHFADLDLDESHGADRLIERIQNAAERVCDVGYGPQTLASREATLDCAIETTELAVRDVGHPLVTARYYDVNPHVIIEEGSYDPYYDDGYVYIGKK